MIDINDLWCTQRSLKRSDMISALKDIYVFSTKIELHRCEDGEIQINNGHHRAAALLLNGRTHLEQHEYVLCDVDITRARTKFKMKDLINQWLQLPECGKLKLP